MAKTKQRQIGHSGARVGNKEELVKKNEEMQLQTSRKCAKLTQSTGLKKPKQVKLNLKKMDGSKAANQKKIIKRLKF